MDPAGPALDSGVRLYRAGRERPGPGRGGRRGRYRDTRPRLPHAGAASRGGAARAGSAARAAAPAAQVTIGITSVSPQVARPGQPVTVQGTVSNLTRSPVSGLSVQLQSSSTPLGSRGALSEYAAGNLQVFLTLAGAPAQLAGTLAPGAVGHWSIRVPVRSLALTSFGVYPLAAQVDSVDSGATALSTARTFLPFWPGSAAAAGLAQRTKIAWIWPIFSAPEQAACPALLSGNLASSLAGGRLSQLLAAGSTPEAVRADLTWAIDPSVLSSAAVMRSSYRVGGTSSCSGAAARRASPAASSWLARLRSVAAQQDYFVTPYADVDMSALTHAALRTDLERAELNGNSVARRYLGGTQRPGGPGVGAIAWPAGGFADFEVLGNLGAGGWRTVILNSSLMPPVTPTAYTPSAITSALDGVNGRLNVALSDSGLGQVLAARPDGRRGAMAAREQAREPAGPPAASRRPASRPAPCRLAPRPARSRPSSCSWPIRP